MAEAPGACTSMTLGEYARRKHWPLASVVVRLRHSTADEMLDRIDRDIELTGNLTKGQRERLLEIADKCPVHRTLTNGMTITSRLVE